MDYLKDAAKVLWCVVQCFCFLSEVIFRLYSLSQKEKCFHYLHMKNAKCAFDKFDDQIEKVDLRTKSILRVVSGFWQILKGKFSYLSILITERNSSIELQLYWPEVSWGLLLTHQNIAEDKQAWSKCKTRTQFSVLKRNNRNSKPSLWLQDEKNSVRLFRVDPVCIIITFSVRQSRHILEEGVKDCALVRIFHLIL